MGTYLRLLILQFVHLASTCVRQTSSKLRFIHLSAWGIRRCRHVLLVKTTHILLLYRCSSLFISSIQWCFPSTCRYTKSNTSTIAHTASVETVRNMPIFKPVRRCHLPLRFLVRDCVGPNGKDSRQNWSAVQSWVLAGIIQP